MCFIAFAAIHAVALIIAFGIAGAGIAIAVLEHKATTALRENLQRCRVNFDNGVYLQSRFVDAKRRYGYLLSTMQKQIKKIQADASKKIADADTAVAKAKQSVDDMKQSCLTLGRQYIEDHTSWIRKGITHNPETFLRKKHTFEKAVAFAKGAGIRCPKADVEGALSLLTATFNQKVQKKRVDEELRELKKQAAEQKKAEAELKKAQAEEARIQSEIARRKAEIEEARRADMAQAAQLTEQLQQMQKELIDAKNDTMRAISNAQRTKVGWVYILSNIGAFGEGVFKIGLTRRYDYEERVKELSGAAVPFPFDVHAAIHCMDAPGLEHALHKALARHRVNRANPRKEFFRCSLEDIIREVQAHHDATVDYVMEPEASQFYESQNVTDEQLLADEEALEAAGFFGGDDDVD